MHEDDIPFFGISQGISDAFPDVSAIDPAIEFQDGDTHTFNTAVRIARCTGDFFKGPGLDASVEYPTVPAAMAGLQS